MGGASFKCPYCSRWTLTKGALRDHLKTKHADNLPTHFEIEGTGPITTISLKKPLDNPNGT